MAQPFNYMGNLPDPSQSVMGGVQNALTLSNIASQRNLADQKSIDMQQARTDALKVAEKQAQMEAELGALSKNPTPAALVSAMVKYPSLSENFKKTHEVLSAEQKDSRIKQASQVYAAMQAGKPEFAQQLLIDQAAAARNAGMEQDAKAAETVAELIKLHPATAETSTGLFLAASMGADKFAETFTKLQADRRSAELQPSELTHKQAEATKAAVAAKFAESTAVIDLQKKGWDITKIQEDIKIAKQNASIAALNAQISRENSIRSVGVASETNALKLKELGLKVGEMKEKRDSAVREKAAELESARANMDNMLNTADRVLKTPIGVIGSAAGPISSRIPTLSQGTADLEALVETLGSQAFLAQIPNMAKMGALSEKEGDKLQASLQNFSLRQSPERLIENVKEAQRLVLKARKNMTLKHGLPETVPDTPAVATSGADLDAIIKKHTR